MGRTRCNVSTVQKRLKSFQDGVGRRGKSGNVTALNTDLPITRRSTRKLRGTTGEVAISQHTTSKLASIPCVPSSLSGKAAKQKVRESTTFLQGATTRGSKRKLDNAVRAGTSCKAKRASPAKRTPKSQKNKCGEKVRNKTVKVNKSKQLIEESDDGEES